MERMLRSGWILVLGALSPWCVPSHAQGWWQQPFPHGQTVPRTLYSLADMLAECGQVAVTAGGEDRDVTFSNEERPDPATLGDALLRWAADGSLTYRAFREAVVLQGAASSREFDPNPRHSFDEGVVDLLEDMGAQSRERLKTGTTIALRELSPEVAARIVHLYSRPFPRTTEDVCDSGRLEVAFAPYLFVSADERLLTPSGVDLFSYLALKGLLGSVRAERLSLSVPQFGTVQPVASLLGQLGSVALASPERHPEAGVWRVSDLWTHLGVGEGATCDPRIAESQVRLAGPVSRLTARETAALLSCSVLGCALREVGGRAHLGYAASELANVRDREFRPIFVRAFGGAITERASQLPNRDYVGPFPLKWFLVGANLWYGTLSARQQWVLQGILIERDLDPQQVSELRVHFQPVFRFSVTSRDAAAGSSESRHLMFW